VAEFAPFAERPLLWKSRVLHFQGHKDIRVAERGDALAMPREGHDDALRLYQSPTVRPSDDNLAKEEPAKQEVYRLAKADASYWLGLLSYDRGNYGVAASWHGDRTLDRDPKGKWANGARYNLARAYEADGKLDEAIKLLESDPEGAPQQHGNLVRAKRLKAKRDAGVTTEGTGSAGGL
jgi:tetratricopeptide (TPR) repeat protein